MPPKSQAQQRAAGMALAVKRGEQAMPHKAVVVTQMAKSMSERQLKEYARSPRKGR
jgi:hypothetical protein